MHCAVGVFSPGAAIGQASTNTHVRGDFTPTSGFWAGAATSGCGTNANSDGKSDGRVIAPFVQCVIAPAGQCHCADLNADSQITIADISECVAGRLSAAECLLADVCHY
jgi:hypothetical protein